MCFLNINLSLSLCVVFLLHSALLTLWYSSWFFFLFFDCCFIFLFLLSASTIVCLNLLICFFFSVCVCARFCWWLLRFSGRSFVFIYLFRPSLQQIAATNMYAISKKKKKKQMHTQTCQVLFIYYFYSCHMYELSVMNLQGQALHWSMLASLMYYVFFFFPVSQVYSLVFFFFHQYCIGWHLQLTIRSFLKQHGNTTTLLREEKKARG